MVVASVDMVRVRRLAEPLRLVGIESLLAIEEGDPQYESISRVRGLVGEGAAAVYAVLVSLASYRLSMRGEEWWRCFSEFVSRRGGSRSLEGIVGDVLAFIDYCGGASIGREGRKRRVSRAYRGSGRLLSSLLEDPSIALDPARVAEGLARGLGEKPSRKTVLFAAKMAYYAVRRKGEAPRLRSDIEMPIDVRVACATYSSGIVRARDYRDLVSSPEVAQRAWREVSRLSGKPVIHLDSLLWLVGWAPRDLPLAEARRAVSAMLGRYIEGRLAEWIALELCSRGCRGI